MKRINGNLTIQLQVYTTTKNDIGEREKTWVTADSLTGFLDLANGDSKYTTQNTKIQESTHLFIAPYKTLNQRIKSDCTRIYEPISQKYYDVMLIDNPMGLNEHYEIYLKYSGE